MAGTKSYCTDTVLTASVIHLHGVIGFAKPADGDNEIVLSERDFLAPASGGWRRDVVTKALSSGPCLFVGVSLTDLNLLSPLYNSHSKYRHVVVYTRDPSLPDGAIKAVENIERKRWGRLKVDCLFADNYSDSSVFVNEVARRRADTAAKPLADLLRRWHQDVIVPYVPAGVNEYVKVQQDLSGTLDDLLKALQATHGMANEVMQLGLFGLGIDGSDEFAHVLATSDRAMKDPRSSERLSVRLPTQWTGVKSMCSAVPVSEPKENYASRWKHMLAVPVRLPDLSWAPVGAIVLSSTDPNSRLSQVRLSGLLTDSPAKLYGALEDAGLNVLRPA